MIRHAVFSVGGGAALLGSIYAFVQTQAQTDVGDVKLSLGSIIGGILLLLSSYLFSSSIRQGKDIVILQTRIGTIEKVQDEHTRELKTIPKQISDSRHDANNKAAEVIVDAETRLAARIDKLERDT